MCVTAALPTAVFRLWFHPQTLSLISGATLLTQSVNRGTENIHTHVESVLPLSNARPYFSLTNLCKNVRYTRQKTVATPAMKVGASQVCGKVGVRGFCSARTAQERVSAGPSRRTAAPLQTWDRVRCWTGDPRGELPGRPHFPDEDTEAQRGE